MTKNMYFYFYVSNNIKIQKKFEHDNTVIYASFVYILFRLRSQD